MTGQPWYAEFFGEDYVRLYRPYLTPERTEREVIGIVNRLRLAQGSRVLDLACGYGRHSIPLAALDYEVTGLDLNPALLARARAMAEDVRVTVRWVRGDMRRLPFASQFDAVINIFTAFGYLENDAQDQRVLDAVARCLVPGGQFLLDTVNREMLVRKFLPAEVERHEDGLLALQEQQFDLLAGRMNVRVTMLEAGGERKEYRQSIRIYSLTELAKMLQSAGLRLEACYGDLDGRALTLESPRLVLHARKPGTRRVLRRGRVRAAGGEANAHSVA